MSNIDLIDDIQLIVRGPDNKCTTATARAVVWTRAMAGRKGAQWCAGCWAVGIFSIVIPIVHFFSVPILLMLGPVLGVIIYKLHVGAVDIEAATGSCPECQGTISLNHKTDSWPLAVKCIHCGAQLTVLKEAGRIL